jgi:molecular chaperone Hsp33
VRLGAVAEQILSQYEYPPVVARTLGELLVVAAMLSANLKSEGILTIQIKSAGPVPLMVADAAYGGALRGYADLAEGAAAILKEKPDATLVDLFGPDAYLAITLDPGENMRRYQGVVALGEAGVAEALIEYFTNSQQLEIMLHLAVTQQAPWNMAGLMIERMPEASPTGQSSPGQETMTQSDSWPYARAVAGTVTNDELLDAMLDAPTLLYRLFHEEGVIVYDAQPLKAQCRCSRERIEKLLLSMPAPERADMVVEGKISVHCQFCNATHGFTPQQVGLSVS